MGCAKVSWKGLKQGSYGLEAREGVGMAEYRHEDG